MIVLLMGVTASGKSTIGSRLAKKLGIDFADADDFHPIKNIALMSVGKPLTDEMRMPWLESVANEIGDYCYKKKDLVVACSSLKRAYRDILLKPSTFNTLAYLKGSRHEIETRLSARKDHFMPSSMLDSQLATLEIPEDDENALEIEMSLSVEKAVLQIINSIQDRHFYSNDANKKIHAEVESIRGLNQ